MLLGFLFYSEEHSTFRLLHTTLVILPLKSLKITAYVACFCLHYRKKNGKTYVVLHIIYEII